MEEIWSEQYKKFRYTKKEDLLICKSKEGIHSASNISITVGNIYKVRKVNKTHDIEGRSYMNPLINDDRGGSVSAWWGTMEPYIINREGVVELEVY